jgi:hypothetical protein
MCYAVVSTMEPALLLIPANAQMDGPAMIVGFLFAILLAYIMEIVPPLEYARVKGDGKDLTVPSQFAHRNVKTAVFAWLPTLASAYSGLMNTAMAVVEEDDLYFANLMVIPKILGGQGMIVQFLYAFKMRNFCLLWILTILLPLKLLVGTGETIYLSV